MESVIKQTYEIILSCHHKYRIDPLKKCMDKHVYSVINKSINYVRRHHYDRTKCKEYIMNLVIESLQECAMVSYEQHRSKQRVNDMMKCIENNIKDLINIAVDAMSLSIQLSTL